MNTETPKTEPNQPTVATDATAANQPTQSSPSGLVTEPLPAGPNQNSHHDSRSEHPLAGSTLVAGSGSQIESQESPHSPYSSFAQFTRDQLLQISAWLDDHIYDKVIDLIKENYGRDISQSALHRFYSKTAFKNHLAQTPETTEAAAQVLEFAATGQPNFTEASLRVLEQTAFQLSPTCRKQPSDLDTLNRITTIICRQKNTAVRERQAKVQEDKNQLRAAELESKKQLAQKRFDLAKETLAFRQQQHQDLLAKGAASSPSPIQGERAGERGPSTAPKFDHLGPLGKPGDWEAVGARCRKQFGETPQEIVSRSNVDAKWKERRQKLQQAQPTASASPTPEPRASVSVQSSNTITTPSAPSAANSTSDFEPRISDLSSVASTMISCLPIPEPLAIAVDAYTVRRAEEYEAHQRRSAHLSNPPQYITQYRHCPCGNPCPCPDHETEDFAGPFREWFWSCSPHEIAYAGSLLDRGLPYRDPNEPSMNAAPLNLNPNLNLTPQPPLTTDDPISDDSIAHSPAQTNTGAAEKLQIDALAANSQKSKIPALSPEELAKIVDAYTVKRAQEYWAYRRQYSDPPPPRRSHPQYITQYKHCPCGNSCPCPTHEDGKFRPFPNSFWTSSPHSDFYYEPLQARGLPYRDPKEFI